MKKLQYLIQIFFFAIILVSCQKEKNTYIDANAPAPSPVTDIKVTATPGGAILTYKIPEDYNLSYVKAMYEIQPGIFREAKSSYYRDSLTLVGFGDTLSHIVKIYSIGKNEKESIMIPITVKPLTPAVKSVFNTLTLDASFGGVQVTFQNSSQANLGITVLVDTTGKNTWSPITTFYTQALNGNFNARGNFDLTQKRFAVVIKDRWNNKSDTLIKELIPWEEKLIDKSLFKVVKLPGDYWLEGGGYKLEKLWDGIYNVSNNLFVANTADFPQWWTVDLGLKTTLSRMKMYQRIAYPYNNAWVKSFEIWGSNAPDVDGGWKNWQKLGSFTSIKPSGLPDPSYTANDMAYVTAGEEFNFVGVIPAIRYLRFVMVENRGGTGAYLLGELTFWGQTSI